MTPRTDSGASRRDVLGKTLAAGAALAAPAAAGAYFVPDLPYPFEALEPYIDTPTMKIHHDKHHATYVANINKAREGKPDVPILDLMADALEAGPGVRNSGGGHYNHAFFWSEMAPPDDAKKTKPSKQLSDLIDSSFGSMDEMKSEFEALAAPGATFGSGWVWVCFKSMSTKSIRVRPWFGYPSPITDELAGGPVARDLFGRRDHPAKPKRVPRLPTNLME